jgi:hypothetical protein
VREQPLSSVKACGGVAGRQGASESVLSDIAENAASIAYPPENADSIAYPQLIFPINDSEETR